MEHFNIQPELVWGESSRKTEQMILPDDEFEPGVVTINCVVCSQHVLNRSDSNLVKTEIGEDVDGNPVLVEERGSGGGGWSEEESILFQWFCKWLNAKPKEGATWDTDRESFPFCEDCKNELVLLFDIRKRIDELEGTLNDGVRGLKEKVKTSEERFQMCGVYTRDERYSKFRKQIIKETKGGAKPKLVTKSSKAKATTSIKTEINENLNLSQSRRSDRKRKPVERYEATEAELRSRLRVSSDPVVVISPEEKATAEQFQDCRMMFNEIGTKLVCLPERRKATKTTKTKVKPKRLKEKARPKTDNLEVDKELNEEYEDYMNLTDKNLDELIEDRNNPNCPEPSELLKKRTKREKKDDDDYLPNADELNNESDESGDAIDDGIDLLIFDDNEDFGGSSKKRRRGKGTKRTYYYGKVDPETKNITYMSLVFTHLENNNYSCPKCDVKIHYNTKTFDQFRGHIFQHHSNRFKCPHCDNYRGSRESGLKAHINRVHKGIRANRKRECPTCGKPCKDTTVHRRHYWTHYSPEERQAAIARGEVPPTAKPKPKVKYQCEECGKKYIAPSELRVHVLSAHTDPSKYNYELCQTCGKSVADFKMKSHCTTYHSKNLRSICLHCDKEFGTKQMLREHLKTHQDYPLKCNICGQGFRKKKVYDGHMNLHNNVRPFTCEHCPMAFGSQHILNKHLKQFHMEGSIPRRRAFQYWKERKFLKHLEEGAITSNTEQMNNDAESNSNPDLSNTY